MTLIELIDVGLTPILVGIGCAAGYYLVTRTDSRRTRVRLVTLGVGIAVAASYFLLNLSSDERQPSYVQYSAEHVQTSAQDFSSIVEKVGLEQALKRAIQTTKLPQKFNETFALTNVDVVGTKLIYYLELDTTDSILWKDFTDARRKADCSNAFLEIVHEAGGNVEMKFNRKSDNFSLGTVTTNLAICTSVQ